MIKLWITNSKGAFDITELTPSITWSGEVSQCARTLSAGIISSCADKNIPAVLYELGNSITMKSGKVTLFEGYILERQKNTESSIIDITCYDKGFYLNKNKTTYKFKNSTPETIVKTVCRDFGIAMGPIAETGVKISRNFIGVSLYQIIQTAYTLASEQTGEQYMIRFAGPKLNVIKKGITAETMVIEGGSNLMSASISESITSMVNQVAIYDHKDKLVRIVKDEEAIKSFGLMQNYLNQPQKTDVTAEAKKLIKDNGITQRITIDNLGNIANIAGGAVVVREPYTGLDGLFYIDADVHTWKSGQYYNKLTVNFKNIMDKQGAGSLPD